MISDAQLANRYASDPFSFVDFMTHFALGPRITFPSTMKPLPYSSLFRLNEMAFAVLVNIFEQTLASLLHAPTRSNAWEGAINPACVIVSRQMPRTTFPRFISGPDLHGARRQR